MMTGLPDFWLTTTGRTLLLLPMSWLYRLVMGVRRLSFRLGVRRQHAMPVPVLVIGNIFVGGTGKTPLVLWVIRYLRDTGRRPGIITRGYGGQATQWPQIVTAESDARAVGDEPVLLARRSGCPVVAGPDRVQAASTLLEQFGCDVIVSDDGLQHYRLARDLEVVVVDTARGLGNGHCLPAGPLREPRRRLRKVDLIVANGGPSWLTPYFFTLRLTQARSLGRPEMQRPLSDFAGQQVHAVTGIGNPERFFTALGRFDIDVVRHPFPDHYPFSSSDMSFDDDLPILMTEKDAVKCGAFADERLWVVPAETVLTEESERALISRIRSALERAGQPTAEGSLKESGGD